MESSPSLCVLRLVVNRLYCRMIVRCVKFKSEDFEFVFVVNSKVRTFFKISFMFLNLNAQNGQNPNPTKQDKYS